MSIIIYKIMDKNDIIIFINEEFLCQDIQSGALLSIKKVH